MAKWLGQRQLATGAPQRFEERHKLKGFRAFSDSHRTHLINRIQGTKKGEKTSSSPISLQHQKHLRIMEQTRSECYATDLKSANRLQQQKPLRMGKPKNAGSAYLLELPMEIILQIFDAILHSDFDSLENGYETWEECDYGRDPEFFRFSIWRDVARLARTCKGLYSMVTPALYRADVRWNRGSSLLLAAKTGSASAIRKSLAAGAEIDMWDFTELYDDFHENQYNGDTHQDTTRKPTEIDMTALHWAAYHRNFDAINVLLENGANIGTMGDLGPWSTNKMRFACAACRRVVSYFDNHFERNGIPWIRSPTWLEDVLQGRAEGEGSNVLYYALTENYEVESWYGLVAYTQEQHDRRHKNKLAAVKALLLAGASMTTHTTILLHALHQACGNWDEEMVAFLLEQGADVHVRDRLGNTPLHFVAMCQGHRGEPPRAVVRVLLRHGADINAKNVFGRTPLQVCFEHEFRPGFASAIALLESGAHLFPGINARTKRGSREDSRDDIRRCSDRVKVLLLEQEEPAGYDKQEVSDVLAHGASEKKAVYLVAYEMLRAHSPSKRYCPEASESLRDWSIEDWEAYWSELQTAHDSWQETLRMSYYL